MRGAEGADTQGPVQWIGFALRRTLSKLGKNGVLSSLREAKRAIAWIFLHLEQRRRDALPTFAKGPRPLVRGRTFSPGGCGSTVEEIALRSDSRGVVRHAVIWRRGLRPHRPTLGSKNSLFLVLAPSARVVERCLCAQIQKVGKGPPSSRLLLRNAPRDCAFRFSKTRQR